jgi:eukaryotic-like serine/threonine-protein kinase
LTSDRAASLTLAVIERFLREHGLDEAFATPLHELLSSSPHVDPHLDPEQDSDVRPATPSGPPTVANAGRNSDFPTVAGVAATVLAVRGGRAPDVAAEPSLRQASASWLVPGALLGAGGMGEVCRVDDRTLHRTLAMKILLRDLAEESTLRERFIAEAQVTAQLAHPGIPPVHEIGEFEDGRPFFTMKEVKGITLAQVIDEAHRDPLGATRWSEQRRLDIFHRICGTVAYAHARGVAHCDLKPANVMVGAFGEVMVMDWGVARLVGASGASQIDEPPVRLEGLAAVESIVAGTPAYMAPEQAGGRSSLLGPAADVYALGVLLFELLSGERPYRGSAVQMVAQARQGSIPPLPRRPGSAADDSLYAIITRAMAPEPADRYPDASAMDGDLLRWREGAMRREKAIALVARAEAMTPEIEPVFSLAEQLRERAGRELALLGADASFEAKEPIWRLQDEADELARRASLRRTEAEQLLLHALAQAPDLEAASALIARMRHGRHRDAERRRAWDEAARHELALREHDTGAFREYLEGRSSFSVECEPPCRVTLHRFVERTRRLVTEFVRDLGETPIVDVEVPVGSYVLELVAQDRPPLRHPISLRRSDGSRPSPPGDSRNLVLHLPAEGELGPGEIYVPAGCLELGGDEHAPGSHRAEVVWVDAFVVQEHPVTFAELSAFLADADGEPYRRGVFRDGSAVWRGDWPAVGLSWEGARAYAAWVARRTGKPWRLLTEIEWEKAARGVDGRYFPWGDAPDASFCHARTVERAPTSPTSIHAFVLDRSPYGVRGLGGNVRDWCEDAAGGGPSVENGCAVPPPAASHAIERIVRGGSWRLPPEAARSATRGALPAAVGYPDVGVRLARSW